MPVLNEAGIIESALRDLASVLEPPCETIVVDAGSADGSRELAREICARHGWRFIEANLSAPSVGRTVSAGLTVAKGEIILVLPADTSLTSMRELIDAVHRGKRCGGFPKRYEPSTPLLQLYAYLQNLVRTRWSKNLVWTNGMFFPRGTPVPTHGFLEDVELSDRLKQSPDWTLISVPLKVSARRYYPNRVARRILVNGLILAAHRLQLADAAKLRRFYAMLK